ncbi:MAG: hypothetical protein JWQ63_4045 [Mucilaginibacter sp.]|nr:hypothetical protein [Mucilaginibacter sp.]
MAFPNRIGTGCSSPCRGGEFSKSHSPNQINLRNQPTSFILSNTLFTVVAPILRWSPIWRRERPWRCSSATRFSTSSLTAVPGFCRCIFSLSKPSNVNPKKLCCLLIKKKVLQHHNQLALYSQHRLFFVFKSRVVRN